MRLREVREVLLDVYYFIHIEKGKKIKRMDSYEKHAVLEFFIFISRGTLFISNILSIMG
jgi:hypothetical protein